MNEEGIKLVETDEQLRQEENGSGRESDLEENGSGGKIDSKNRIGEESDSEENGSEGESDSERNGSEGKNGEISSKRMKGDLVDRLSSLPEPLLIHILSRLGNMEKAISTSVLSKRWKYLWSDLPELSFRNASFKFQEARKLVTRVNRAISLRTVKSLVRLEICFVYNKFFASDVKAWIVFALKQKVKYLVLGLGSWRGFYYKLPQEIYSCPSLTDLVVQGCIVEPRGSINWKKLTKLEIEDVKLHEDVIQKILSGCSVLRDLSLTACWGFKCLHINSKILDSFSIQERKENEVEEEADRAFLEISAPYLRSLHVNRFPIDTKELRIKNIQSLVEADIDFTESPSSIDVVNNVMEIFRSIRHVNKLEIGRPFVKILSDMVASGFQLPLSLRESLIIVAERDSTISAILALLESSPCLESLILDCYEDYGNAIGPITKQDLDLDLTRLKTVHLLYYADPNSEREPMLTLARVLLKRATVLEKMVVDAEGIMTKHSPNDPAKIAQTLLSYPKASQNATISFIP